MKMEEFKVDINLPMERQIQQLEDNDIKLWHAVTGAQSSIQEMTIRIDESNRYLREQNTQILSAVLEGNREREANKSKFWIAAIGSGGVVALFLQLLFQLLSTN